jgi:tetratricopeptide (TPR) repeat protein
MKSTGTKTILPTMIIILGFVAMFSLTNFIERNRPALPDDYGDSDLNLNGSSLKGFAFGMEGLIADWYYMRSLQYIGEKLISQQEGPVNIDDMRYLNPRLLYPLLNNATDLDPHYIAAYSYGAVIMPAIDPDKAIQIAEKGIANNPNEWRLYQYLGYIYWRLGNYEKAAEVYEQGSRVPGAAGFMKIMAAAMKTEGGSRDTARKIYRQMMTDSDDENVKSTAEKRLAAMDSLDEREAIDKALADFRQANGRCVGTLPEILPALRGVRLPEGRDFRIDRQNRIVDPSDAPYLLDKDNCRVKLDPDNTGLPLN